jgi:hypothetical protein
VDREIRGREVFIHHTRLRTENALRRRCIAAIPMMHVTIAGVTSEAIYAALWASRST